MQAHAERVNPERVSPERVNPERVNPEQSYWPLAVAEDRSADHSEDPDAPTDGLLATVRGVSLIDLLQMYHLARQSVVLRCADRIHLGEIHLRGGEVVHAYTAGRAGRDAMRQLLGLRAGLVTSEPAQCRGPQSIDEPLPALLLDLVREIDENSRQDCQSRVPSTPPARKPVAHPVALPCVPLRLRADPSVVRRPPRAPGRGYPWDNLRIDDAEFRALARRGAPSTPKRPPTALGPWIGLAALWVSALGFVCGLLG